MWHYYTLFFFLSSLPCAPCPPLALSLPSLRRNTDDVKAERTTVWRKERNRMPHLEYTWCMVISPTSTPEKLSCSWCALVLILCYYHMWNAYKLCPLADTLLLSVCEMHMLFGYYIYLDYTWVLLNHMSYDKITMLGESHLHYFLRF